MATISTTVQYSTKVSWLCDTKTVRGGRIGEEETELLLFENDMIIYIKNEKECKPKLWKLMFSKFTGYKDNLVFFILAKIK